MRVPKQWVAAVACVAGALALGLWLTHTPSAKVEAQPLHVPKLTNAQPKAHSTDSPENEGPAEEAPLMPVGTADLPEQLDRRQLEAGMAKAKIQIERCRRLEEFVGSLTVKLTIAKSGNVQSAVLVSPADKSQTSDCVLKTVRNASFPRFRGTLLPTVELTYPLLFRQEGGPL
jgi:hypothetical protein